ncbi:hypothetical protein BUALT_Bualt14G0029400 [Buddleja alternifolia]|uniref:SWIM-type domain-containing protein n=1 Tax=Buddleja alternifolia TaxID=168488 RepID=A0AAV6WNZ9_9LAMI|nr:hypothetical protein BUALT_Bualt14G0029400 [Buddleja alternifolia]
MMENFRGHRSSLKSEYNSNSWTSVSDLEENYGEDAEATEQCGEHFQSPEPSLSKHQEVHSVSSLIHELENRLAIGVKDERRSRGRIPDYQKSVTRTKCKARIRIGQEKGREWRVIRFVIEHNHEMVATDQTHLLRSSRNISHAQKSTLEAMVNAGISTATAVSFMEEEARGPENLGFIRKDAYDYLSRLKKQTKIKNEDASKLLKHFLAKSNNEPFFYWDVQLDDENRVMNFFFRDYRCRIDYEYFGDVLSVDTTYKTNRYDLICAPFVGLNHHKQNVMFGLAFMSNETQESFEWLFGTFLESMSGKQPETVFTDQCQAMMNAVENIFPCAHHRLCQWHINQNAPSHLGNLNCDSRFKEFWYKCMNHCDSEEEFEATWRKMIHEYNLSGHKWLNGMYKLRQKWATAFSKHRFSAGLLATSRSEGTNSVLKKAGDRTISLYDFVLSYEKIQKTWRENEKVVDTRCRHGKPSMIVNNLLLNHAADVYTLTIYKLFEKELVNSLSTEFTEDPLFIDPFVIQFKMKSHNQHSSTKIVLFDKQRNEINCSCNKFESMGILCKHDLKVLNYVKVHSIPEGYLKKRWMKNIRNRVSDEGNGSGCESGNSHVSEMVFSNYSMRRFYDLTMLCKAREETRNMLSEFLDKTIEKMNAWFENLSLSDSTYDNFVIDENNEESNEMHIRNPLFVKSRGITNARIRGHWDEKNKKGKGKRKPESSKGIAKSTKQKGQILETSINEFPSQEATNASMSQEATNVQLSSYPIHYPFQEASFTNQPYWPRPISFAIVRPMSGDMQIRGASEIRNTGGTFNVHQGVVGVEAEGGSRRWICLSEEAADADMAAEREGGE